MRDDLSKQICEDGRSGSRCKIAQRIVRHRNKHQIHKDPDILPTKEGIRAPYSGPGLDRKEFGEHLAPLYGFLNKSAGRPWNDVFSEICSQVTLDSTQQRHIREHVFDLVEINIKIINGVPHEIQKYSTTRGWVPHYHWRYRSKRQMYVDPNDGILKFSPKDPTRLSKSARKKRDQAAPKNWVKISELKQARLIDGIWYEIEFRKPTKDEIAEKRFGYWTNVHCSSVELIANPDKKTKRQWQNIDPQFSFNEAEIGWKSGPWRGGGYSKLVWDWETSKKRYGRYMFPIRKRQLSSSEIRRIKKQAA